MARVVKVDNSILKRIKQKQDREKRKYRTREKRVRVLIVCEGEKTEPNYFGSIDKRLPKGLIELKISGIGDNTINVVESAMTIRGEAATKGHPYDHVWAVFDRDSFPPERFNEAVFLADRENINCAYSNEAFELWYLLHFEFYNTAISRHDYISRLENFIGERYQKNQPDMFERLEGLGSQVNAINWAKQLEQRYDGLNPSLENPVTKVYKLIEFLNTYMTE